MILHQNLKLSGGGKNTATAHSGLILTHDVMSYLGLQAAADKWLPAPASNRGYQPSVILSQALLLLHAGGRHLADLRLLARDGLFFGTPVISDDTLSKALHKWGTPSGQSHLDALHRHMLHQCLLSVPSQQPLVLDIDDTVIDCEKKEALYAYTGKRGFMATFAHLADCGFIVHSRLRPGNRPPSGDQVSFLQATRKQLGDRPIDCLRADSASYQSGVIEDCFQHDTRFVIKAKIDASIRQKVDAIPRHHWRYVKRQKGGVWMTETTHSLQHSKHLFRLILICEDEGQLPLIMSAHLKAAIATDLDGTPAEIAAFYRQRGEHSENRIKELKHDFAANCLPCSRLAPNAAWLKLNAIAYNLHAVIRQTLFPAKRHTLSTVRWRCYHIAGVITYHSRQWRLKVSDSFYKKLARYRQTLHRQLAP